MRFARLNPGLLTFKDIVEMEQAEYDALLISNPPKAALLRPLVTDPLPTIDPATQKIVAGPIVIEATQARETWVVVAKTAEEIQADNDTAAANVFYATISTTLADLTAGTGNNTDRLIRLEQACIRLLTDENRRRLSGGV
jgi:hypothetical protein